MRKPWMVMALLITALLCTDAIAQVETVEREVWDGGYRYPGWLCEECRDPTEFPEDYAAFAFNAYFGDEPWAFTSQLGIPFRVYNLELQWVVIWFEGFLFDGISLWPDTMDIFIRLPSGEIVRVEVVQNGPDMPIGENGDAPVPAVCSCGGGGDEYDEDEYSDDDEEFFWEEEEPEPYGVVEIEDPNEDGEFEEWVREL